MNDTTRTADGNFNVPWSILVLWVENHITYPLGIIVTTNWHCCCSVPIVFAMEDSQSLMVFNFFIETKKTCTYTFSTYFQLVICIIHI